MIKRRAEKFYGSELDFTNFFQEGITKHGDCFMPIVPEQAK